MSLINLISISKTCFVLSLILNKYKVVDLGGLYNNNFGIINDKIELFSSYKFSIAMKNIEGGGYL